MNEYLLEERFKDLFETHAVRKDVSHAEWKKVARQYKSKTRFYHNLSHLSHIYRELEPLKRRIQNWPGVQFAIFYHDYYYNVLRKDNESRSAKRAIAVLQKIDMDKTRIDHCAAIINATKTHEANDDPDTQLFLDADMCILGQSAEKYDVYSAAVRKEFWIYPDSLYNKGRINVLEHFLQMKRIFKTTEFYERYEQAARNNISRELNQRH